MDKNITTARLILAIVSTALEEVAIYVIWRWLLPEFDIRLSFSVCIGVMATNCSQLVKNKNPVTLEDFTKTGTTCWSGRIAACIGVMATC